MWLCVREDDKLLRIVWNNMRLPQGPIQIYKQLVTEFFKKECSRCNLRELVRDDVILSMPLTVAVACRVSPPLQPRAQATVGAEINQ